MGRDWCIQSLRRVVSVGTLLGAIAIAPPAVGQTELLFDLFEGDDTVDPSRGEFQRLADAVRRAQRPSTCPLGEITISRPQGDPLFYQAVAQARRDAVLGQLEMQGLGAAGRMFIVIDAAGKLGKFDAKYSPAHDDKPPTLRVQSDPREGSKVQPGQRIVVRMSARDDADRWQTGVKTIQVVADSEGGRFIASENYEPCSDPKEKRIEATYRVPADPPPIVRLTVLAEDHSGHQVKATAEFPTGDFHGTFTYPTGQPPLQYSTRADLVLNHDGNGNLAGVMVGETSWIDASTAPGCFTSMVRPHHFRVELKGAYTEGRSLKVFLGDIEDTPMILNNRCATYNTTDEVNHLGFKNYVGLGWVPEQPFLGTPSPLGEGEVRPDGARVYKMDTMTVTLRRADP